jgi:hypothetical protein
VLFSIAIVMDWPIVLILVWLITGMLERYKIIACTHFFRSFRTDSYFEAV